MSQGYNSGPADNAFAAALTIRQNLDALLTSNAGFSLPGYAKQGSLYFSELNQHLYVAKSYGSKAFGEYLMGTNYGLTLAFALTGSGQTGADYDVLVRVRTATVMGGLDHLWELMSFSPMGFGLTIDFDVNFQPGYFCGRIWNDPIIGEPVLYTNDGELRTKLWDSIPAGHDSNVYSGSPSPLMNNGDISNDTLRAVDLECKEESINWSFPVLAPIVPDHIVLPTLMQWWEVQDLLVGFTLYDRGIRRNPATYKAVPFFGGGQVQIALYNRDPIANSLAPFCNDGENYYELIIHKKV